MPEPPVVNSSPLIVLSRAGMLDLLRLAGDRILVPKAVALEINEYGSADIAAQALRATEWIEVVEAPSIPMAVRNSRLGAGESAVLAWALSHPDTQAILDDQSARRRAAALGVPTIGTLRLILDAKDQGLIDEAAPAIERARRAGLYL
ncbi:MAG: DUF3368 domain-containing protein, partial [Dehalococcoidia bacterium]